MPRYGPLQRKGKASHKTSKDTIGDDTSIVPSPTWMRRHMTTDPASKNKNQQTTSDATNARKAALVSDGGNPLQRSDSLASASNPQAAKSTKTASDGRKEESALHADPSTPVPNGSSPSVPDTVSLTSVPDTASPTSADETASPTSPDETASPTSPDETDHVNCDDASKRKEQSVEQTETLSKTRERIILQKHSDSSIKNYGNLDICRSNSGSQVNPSMGSMSHRGSKQNGRYGRLRQALLTTSVTIIQGDDPSGPTAACDMTGADDDTTATTGISAQNSDAVSLQDLTPGAMSKSITFDHSVYIKTVPRYGPLSQRTKLHKKPPLPANSMIPVDVIRMNHEGSSSMDNSFSSDIIEGYLKDVKKKRHIRPTQTIHSAASVAASAGGVTTKNDDDAQSEINTASQSKVCVNDETTDHDKGAAGKPTRIAPMVDKRIDDLVTVDLSFDTTVEDSIIIMRVPEEDGHVSAPGDSDQLLDENIEVTYEHYLEQIRNERGAAPRYEPITQSDRPQPNDSKFSEKEKLTSTTSTRNELHDECGENRSSDKMTRAESISKVDTCHSSSAREHVLECKDLPKRLVCPPHDDVSSEVTHSQCSRTLGSDTSGRKSETEKLDDNESIKVDEHPQREAGCGQMPSDHSSAPCDNIDKDDTQISQSCKCDCDCEENQAGKENVDTTASTRTVDKMRKIESVLNHIEQRFAPHRALLQVEVNLLKKLKGSDIQRITKLRKDNASKLESVTARVAEMKAALSERTKQRTLVDSDDSLEERLDASYILVDEALREQHRFEQSLSKLLERIKKHGPPSPQRLKVWSADDVVGPPVSARGLQTINYKDRTDRTMDELWFKLHVDCML